jgi:hypothetical protein
MITATGSGIAMVLIALAALGAIATAEGSRRKDH